MAATISQFRYDVFISYSHRDQDWVRGDLLKKLEAGGLQVCIDFRDFEVGAPSVKEMVRAVEASRKTLLVLTPAYLESDWTEFESSLVQTLDPANKRRRLIPLCKSRCQLPPEISYLTYVNFYEPQYVDIEWKKLLIALEEPPHEETGLQLEVPRMSSIEDTSRSAREGIEALVELMRDPAVQSNAATFETVFRTSCHQIDVLAYYKDLHDLLHTLQFKCYNYIIRVVRGPQTSPDYPSLWDSMCDYELDLQKLLNDMEVFSKREAPARTNISWLGSLLAALKSLLEAIKNSDLAQMNVATQPISRILAIQPMLINSRLNEAAHALPLPDLENALTRVYEKIARARAYCETVAKFKNGLSSLGELNLNLVTLINAHDQWQEMDVELRRIEANMGQDFLELESSWQDLRVRIEAQCSGVTESWAPLLIEDSVKLNDALTAQDPVQIRQYFHRCRTQADHRFYEVDLMLKELCSKLLSIGYPLATVLEMI
jgi:hypothetical protein